MGIGAFLLAGSEVVPELLQEDCTAENLAVAVEDLLDSEEARETQRAGFRDVWKALGESTPPPSARAAKLVLDVIGGERKA